MGIFSKLVNFLGFGKMGKMGKIAQTQELSQNETIELISPIVSTPLVSDIKMLPIPIGESKDIKKTKKDIKKPKADSHLMENGIFQWQKVTLCDKYYLSIAKTYRVSYDVAQDLVSEAMELYFESKMKKNISLHQLVRKYRLYQARNKMKFYKDRDFGKNHIWTDLKLDMETINIKGVMKDIFNMLNEGYDVETICHAVSLKKTQVYKYIEDIRGIMRSYNS